MHVNVDFHTLFLDMQRYKIRFILAAFGASMLQLTTAAFWLFLYVLANIEPLYSVYHMNDTLF